MPVSKQVTLAALSALLLSVPAHATDYLVGYVGYFDVVDQDNSATQFGAEYRGSAMESGIRPMVGGNFTTDGAAYGYVGIDWELPLIDRQLYIIPNFAVGAYAKGNGKNMGGPVEFRSGVELDYELNNSHRLGAAFNHLSNFDMYTRNPGSETALVSYSMPMDSLFPANQLSSR